MSEKDKEAPSDSSSLTEKEFPREDNLEDTIGEPFLVTGGARDAVEAKEKQSDPLIGTVVGRIRIEALLGEGGMGRVYRGFHEVLERPVALKIILGLFSSPDLHRRFRREAKLLSSLNHPGICQVHDFLETDHGDFLVLELLNGETLSQSSPETRTFSQKLHLAEQIADALGAAHGQRIIHRDLKPDNIMIGTDGTVKVLDFGIARLSTDLPRLPDTEDASAIPSLTDSHLTQEGAILGTLTYMSPEQALGEGVTEASDIYSLGLILQELFTGKKAQPSGLNRMELIQRVARGESSAVEGLDADLAEFIESLKAFAPAERPSAREVQKHLKWLIEAPVRLKRRRLAQGFGLMMVLVVLAALAAIVQSRLSARRQTALAREFAQTASEVEWGMRAVYLSPPHEIKSSKEAFAAKIEALEGQLDDLGEVGKGPGHYALGSGWLMLREFTRARDHLEESWSAGFREPRTALALGRVLTELMRHQWRYVNALPEEVRDLEKARLYEESGERIENLFSQVISTDPERRAVAQSYLDLLHAFFNNEFVWKASGPSVPWDYEYYLTLGDFWEFKTRSIPQTSSRDLYEKAVVKASEAYADALRVGRADPWVHRRHCYSRSRVAKEKILSWAHPDELNSIITEVESLCSQGLEVDESDAILHLSLGTMDYLRGLVAYSQGQSPLASFESAAEKTAKAESLDSSSILVRGVRAIILKDFATFKSFTGNDPSGLFVQALDLGQGLRRDYPKDLYFSVEFTDLLGRVIEHAITVGSDLPQSALDNLPQIQSMSEHYPDLALVQQAVGQINWSLGRYYSNRGGPQAQALEQSRHSLRVAAQQGDPTALYYLALTTGQEAWFLLESGSDPADLLEESLTTVDRLIAAVDSSGNALALRGFAKRTQASWTLSIGENPGLAIEEGLAAFSQLAEQRKPIPEVQLEWARLYLTQAQHLLDENVDPRESLAKAKNLIDSAIQSNPRGIEALSTRFWFHLLQAESSFLFGRVTETALLKAQETWVTLKKLDPNSVYRHLQEAELSLAQTQWQKEVEPTTRHRGLRAARKALVQRPEMMSPRLLAASLILEGDSLTEKEFGEAAEYLEILESVAPYASREVARLRGLQTERLDP